MIINRNATSEEVLAAFADSVQEVLTQVDEKMKALEAGKDDDPTTKGFYTRKIIFEWFRKNGGI